MCCWCLYLDAGDINYHSISNISFYLIAIEKCKTMGHNVSKFKRFDISSLLLYDEIFDLEIVT